MDSKALAIILGILFFFYIPTPVLVSVSPNSGTNSGLVNVVLNGDKFDKSATVKLVMEGQEDITARDVQVISPNKIACTLNLKDQQAGKWDVVVHNKVIKSATLKGGFTITASAPQINAIIPQRAYNNTTVSVEIKGAAFKTGATVMLNSRQMNTGAANVKVVSDSLITCELNLNGAALGTYDVKVANVDGTSGTLANGFSVEDLPKPELKIVKPEIAGIDPSKGFNNGMILTKISGSNFEPGSTVKLSRNGQLEIPGLNTKVEDSTQISCFFDINGKPEGKYNLEVLSPSGQKTVLENGFTVERFTPNSLELNKSLKAVYFDLNKAGLRRDQLSALDADSAVLKKYPKLYILLGGHADERGTIEYNLDLSERRATVIKKYLLERGIDSKRITIYAYGKEFPLKKGHNESSWWQNRRVDIMVWEAPPTKEQGIEGMPESGAKK
jgi:Outer membrane protein and related peptidoglycan-associated (lipo)proteins